MRGNLADEGSVGLDVQDDVFPASHAQRRLWFLDAYEPGSPWYNIPGAWWLRGPLDTSVLERCIEELCRRHETLRTRFAMQGNELVQQVSPPRPIPLQIIDLRSRPDPQAAARGWVEEEASRPFDLDVGPLIRVALLRPDSDLHVLSITLHHIVADGWSVGILMRDLQALYTAYSAGSSSPLPEPELQYADYAVWEQERLRPEAMQGHLAYWTQALEGAPAWLDLTRDRGHSPQSVVRGATLPFDIDETTVAALHALARSNGCSLFMVLAAALAVVLGRNAGQDEVCIGYPVANRDNTALESIVGFFTNTLVLRIYLGGNPTFEGLLAQVRESVLEADVHKEVPFEMIVRALHPERDTDHSPLFQVMLSLDNTSDSGLRLPGLHVETLAPTVAGAKFELNLDLVHQADRLVGGIEYRPGVFDPSTIERLGGQYRVLLGSIVADPRRAIGSLQLQRAEERQRALALSWGPTLRSGAPFVHEMVERQAADTPNAIALLHGDAVLRFGELNARANRLARKLRSLGVKPDDLVAVCAEPGVALVLGLLATLKAGAAYVPIDPAYPPERVAFMLKDTAAPVLLVQEKQLRRFGEQMARILVLESECEHGADNLPLTLRPSNLAYCIYTSGSTGKPKGALNTHEGFANLVRWYFSSSLGTRANERVVLASSISFDLTQKNVFAPLAHGATLVIPAGIVGDADSLHDAVQRHRPTRINCAPTAYKLLRRGHAMETLNSIVLGGEPIEPDLASSLLREGADVVNSYGPTECADVAGALRLGNSQVGRVVALGYPIPNVRIYVLDASLEPAPPGVVGEIHIGGIGVGRGYLKRPGLTAEKFIPDPHGDPGSRMYATGDLARRGVDGCIEFCGRADHQVKILGMRVELGEIEAALRAVPDLADVAVLLCENEAGERVLVGYIVPKGSPPSVQALRSRLLAELPVHMVPSAWVFLEALPLSPNGKLDRRALPRPAATSVRGDASYAAPRTPTEIALADLWAEVLHLDRVGVDDNFFAIGGHSLVASGLVRRINDRFGTSLSLRKLFLHPTVATLANQLQPAVEISP